MNLLPLKTYILFQVQKAMHAATASIINPAVIIFLQHHFFFKFKISIFLEN
jgi:hypothetical protein